MGNRSWEATVAQGLAATHGVEVPAACPVCGEEIEEGYGLCGGGIGTYWFCSENMDHYFTKKEDHDA